MAAPVQAAKPASALSLSRAGRELGGSNGLSALPVGTWLSLGAILAGLYFSIDALSDKPVSA